MNLILFRHAIAEEPEDFYAETGLSDEQRPLTEKGKEKFKNFLEFLDEMLPEPDVIITSPLVRTRQTAEIIRKNFGTKDLIECPALKPGGRSAAVHDFMQSYKGKETIYLVGHNPDMGIHVNYFVRGNESQSFCEFKKGGFVWLQLPEAMEKGKAQLVCSLHPPHLRASQLQKKL